nr:hypothetical protein CFP56_33583 [Quercus suber]
MEEEQCGQGKGNSYLYFQRKLWVERQSLCRASRALLTEGRGPFSFPSASSGTAAPPFHVDVEMTPVPFLLQWASTLEDGLRNGTLECGLTSSMATLWFPEVRGVDGVAVVWGIGGGKKRKRVRNMEVRDIVKCEVYIGISTNTKDKAGDEVK